MKQLRNIWWLYLIRGIVAVLFGLGAVAYPQKTILFITSLFGLFILIDGVLVMTASLVGIKQIKNWWLLFLQGAFALFIGLAIFAWTEITIVIFFFLFALWILFTGIMLIVTALLNRNKYYGVWTLVAGGILSILFSILLLSHPSVGLTMLTVISGIFLLVYGILAIAFSFDLRSINRDLIKK